MLQLPIIKRDPKESERLCQCLPICKNRRREWKGEIQKTSTELLMERKPLPLCRRRCPKKVNPNNPCPLLAHKRHITLNERYAFPKPLIVKICQAPIEDSVDTPYLRYAMLAHSIGAWGIVHACCAFCECGTCCPCKTHDYVPQDAERASRRRSDMRNFDSRVKTDHQNMRIMYDKM